MSDVARAGVSQLITVADGTTGAAVDAVRELENLAVKAAESGIKVGDKSIDAAVDELDSLREEFIGALRRIADKLTEPLP